MSSGTSITLSLISHTNVGKTTLARTLLRRDVGRVLDQPHVTDENSVHTLLEAKNGDALLLWDTPGFGDSARLLRRLENSDNPLGWFLTQVWDRFGDRALWCSQQAVRNVKSEAHVVLYLVNAAELPEDANYVAMEMKILSWIGVPVVVLLNQTGPPRERKIEKEDEDRWRAHLANVDVVKDTLSLDAFARCWVQEGLLLDAVRAVIQSEQESTFRNLSAVWREQNMERYHDSLRLMSNQLARAVTDRSVVEQASLTDRLRRIVFSGSGSGDGLSGKETSMAVLAERLDLGICNVVNEIIALHELEGHAAKTILERLRTDYEMNRPVSEGISAVLGGMVSGALLGLGSDLAAGGLTFGGGALVGGVLGAAGAGGLAKGYNLVKGESEPTLRWSESFFEGLVRSSLLRYLAIAHYGRGRGDYAESEHPKFWQSKVELMVERYVVDLKATWELARDPGKQEAVAEEIYQLLLSSISALLVELYPEAKPILQE